MQKYKRIRKVKTTKNSKRIGGGNTFPVFKLYFITRVIKIVLHWHKNRQITLINRTELKTHI